MKRIFQLFIILCLLSGSFFVQAQAASSITVKVDGKIIDFPDAKPYVNSDNRTMVPVRFVAEALGCDVYWEVEGKGVVTIHKGGNRINLKIGESKATYNGTVRTFDTSAIIVDGRTFVPLHFIGELLGEQVTWDPVTNTVSVITPKTDSRDTTKECDPLPEDFSAINKDIPQELYKYPYNKDARSDTGFATNKTLVEEWSKTRDNYDLDLILKTAKGYKELDDTVDYRTIGEDYKKRILYYFSSGGNGNNLVDEWIKEVKDNTLVSEARFITDKSLIYNASDGRVRVRGRFQIIYHSPTKQAFMESKGMVLDKWYQQDMEIVLIQPVDNHAWEHGAWTFNKKIYLSEIKSVE
jgi:hypothetical protein